MREATVKSTNRLRNQLQDTSEAVTFVALFALVFVTLFGSAVVGMGAFFGAMTAVRPANARSTAALHGVATAMLRGSEGLGALFVP
ncbi:MAG TPA: hypothetical protein VHJ34_11115 [Actinomycetota bacterium]|nr:hypothetical protein [Actinomycetota bacterium]